MSKTDLEHVHMKLTGFDWVIYRNNRPHKLMVIAEKRGAAMYLETVDGKVDTARYKDLVAKLPRGCHLELDDELVTVASRPLLVMLLREYFTDPIAEWVIYHRKTENFEVSCKRWYVESNKLSQQGRAWK